MSIIRFTSTLMENTGKSGIITPNERGYYPVALGALNGYSRSGDFYTADQVIQLFQQSSMFMRRINNGSVYIEVGHPKILPGMTEEDYYRRIMTIEEGNICGHIGAVTIDLDFGKKHPDKGRSDAVGIFGEVLPAGVHAEVLRAALLNPHQNLAFSLRGITDNLKLDNGQVIRYIRAIVTYDYVGEGGIITADRNLSPALESSKEPVTGYLSKAEPAADLDILIHRDVMENVLHTNLSRIGLESNDKAFFEDIKEAISKTKRIRQTSRTIIDWT